VLVARVNDHVGLWRHVAHAVAGCPQFQAVRLVTITAGDAGVIHSALDKGAVDIHLVVDLSVRVIHTCIEQSWQVMIE
jgi:hypothetical protein